MIELKEGHVLKTEKEYFIVLNKRGELSVYSEHSLLNTWGGLCSINNLEYLIYHYGNITNIYEPHSLGHGICIVLNQELVSPDCIKEVCQGPTKIKL